MKRILLLLPLLAIAGTSVSGLPTAGAQETARPNVLVIITDDQRASPDGYRMLPNLMSIVRDNGTWFRNAVATIPLCCPSRVSIFTGQYAHNHETLKNGGKSWTAEEQRDSLQFTLRAAGYRTAVAGKFLNFWGDNPPYFDRWATFSKLGYYGSTFNVDGRSVTTQQYSTAFIRDRALDFLDDFERTDATPWLMFVEPWAPHEPARPQEKYVSAPIPAFQDTPATTESDRSDKPTFVRAATVKRQTALATRAKMLRSLMSVDDMAAFIRDKLDALGEDNTVVVFLSDNGYQWFEHKLIRKRYPYEDSVRIPMFISWPGHIPAGAQKDNIVATIDLAPTLYDLLGISPAYTVDGRSMFASRRDHILLEYFHESYAGAPPTWRSLWAPGWTYVEYENVTQSDRREYYGPNDPWQLDNAFGNTVVGDEPANRQELAATLAGDSVCKGTSCP